jgi:glycosyltransferase involved in cell wall biosynthesis
MTSGEQPPLLSICIPTYERPSFLSACLRSIIEGPPPPDGSVEIVISDNSAKPEARSTMDELLSSWNGPTRYVQNVPAVTAEENFNRCLELGRGSWLLILHDDDSLSSGVAPILEGVATASSADQVMLFGVNVVDETGRRIRTQRFRRLTRLDPAEALRRVLTDSSWVRFPALVARKSAYDEVGEFDADLKNPTDLDMWVRLFSRYGVLCLPQISANYTIHSGALSEGMFTAETIERLDVIFGRAGRIGLLTEPEMRRCKAALLHQFILAGAWRRLRARDRRGAARVMELFDDDHVRAAGLSPRWLPVRVVLRLVTL